MTNKINFTIGSDPEVFLKKRIDGIEEYFPAISVIEGDKYNPTPIDSEGRAILVDNVMLEFNTLPTTNISDFVEEHTKFMNYLRDEMYKEECKISKRSYVEFHPRFLDNDSAQTFGCEPDYSAYTLLENNSPNPNTNFRSAAGHIHIGYNNHDNYSNIKLIKLLDFTIGLQSVLDDSDRHRRRMYGKAGAHRIKPEFGFEYRVLSNYWIFDTMHMKRVYNGIEKAFYLFDIDFKLSKSIEEATIKAINTYDVELANKIINEQLNKIT
jgi:hypothetical protein